MKPEVVAGEAGVLGEGCPEDQWKSVFYSHFGAEQQRSGQELWDRSLSYQIKVEMRESLQDLVQASHGTDKS